jgi:hypothetical protein
MILSDPQVKQPSIFEEDSPRHLRILGFIANFQDSPILIAKNLLVILLPSIATWLEARPTACCDSANSRKSFRISWLSSIQTVGIILYIYT